MQKVREKTDLSELNQRQEIIATQKLVEKITAFSLSNLYDGKLIKPQMKILLQRCNTNRFPRPLYTKIEGYVVDLFDRGWIES